MAENSPESAPRIETKVAAQPVSKSAESAPRIETKVAAQPVSKSAESAPRIEVKPAAQPVVKPAVAAVAKEKPAVSPATGVTASIGRGPIVVSRDQIYGKANITHYEPAPLPAGAIAAKPPEHEMGRRAFISSLGIGWFAFTAATAGSMTLMGRFMFPNVLFEPAQSFKAGFPEEYEVGEVSEKWKEKFGTWIVRTPDGIYALSTVCTHLGCTPNWLANEGKFKCPCHGSGYRRTGVNFEGPAPRPLERFKITLTDDGQILIDKTKTFQQEKGEWTDPDAFLRV